LLLDFECVRESFESKCTLALKKRLQNNQQTLLDITNTAKEDVQSVDLLAVSNVELCLINFGPIIRLRDIATHTPILT
jgi:hypothetical protein